jgi:glyceraldehyde-3-phosphate dehydrogenase (NADP+)
MEQHLFVMLLFCSSVSILFYFYIPTLREVTMKNLRLALAQGLVEDAREKGAEFLTEWRRENNLLAPVLLDRVTPDMRIAWEEPFGPVLPVLRVNSIDEAVHHCNSSNLGLQGCVFTRDINTAMRVSDAMQTGTVQVNAAPARGPDHFPFQGFRDSGIGSQGIKNSLAMMTKIKSTVINLDKESYTLG